MKKTLILLFVSIFILVGCTSSVAKELTIKQAKDLIEKEPDILIIDVRTEEEYKLGHIKGAVLIPYDQLTDNLDMLSEYKNKSILVYCRTQNRSEIAKDILIDNGFAKIYQMIDGYSKWE